MFSTRRTLFFIFLTPYSEIDENSRSFCVVEFVRLVETVKMFCFVSFLARESPEALGILLTLVLVAFYCSGTTSHSMTAGSRQMSARVVYIVLLVFRSVLSMMADPHAQRLFWLVLSLALTALASFPTLILCIVLGSVVNSSALISKLGPPPSMTRLSW